MNAELLKDVFGKIEDKPSLEFDEETHTYSVGGKWIPGVGEILKGVGAIDTTWFRPSASTRGTDVHTATELLEDGTLDWFSLPEECVGYVKAYEKFLKETEFNSLEIERMEYASAYWFSGTFDRTGMLEGKNVVLDIKTGQKQKWWKWQLAAYQILAGYEYERRTLRLRANGRYSIDPYPAKDDPLSQPEADKRDRNEFKSMATAYNAVKGNMTCDD